LVGLQLTLAAATCFGIPLSFLSCFCSVAHFQLTEEHYKLGG